MDRRNMARIMLEGALNGIGFVIGTAIVGLVLSGLLILAHHVIAFVALPIIGIVLWLSFRGRRVVKARLERVRIEEFHPRWSVRQRPGERAIADAAPRSTRPRPQMAGAKHLSLTQETTKAIKDR
jgi:hypothetical protein